MYMVIKINMNPSILNKKQQSKQHFLELLLLSMLAFGDLYNIIFYGNDIGYKGYVIFFTVAGRLSGLTWKAVGSRPGQVISKTIITRKCSVAAESHIRSHNYVSFKIKL